MKSWFYATTFVIGSFALESHVGVELFHHVVLIPLVSLPRFLYLSSRVHFFFLPLQLVSFSLSRWDNLYFVWIPYTISSRNRHSVIITKVNNMKIEKNIIIFTQKQKFRSPPDPSRNLLYFKFNFKHILCYVSFIFNQIIIIIQKTKVRSQLSVNPLQSQIWYNVIIE